MSEGDTNRFQEIIARLRREFATPQELILPTPLGPIELQNLTNVLGWEYVVTPAGFPGNEIVLVRGAAPIIVFQSSPDEVGWFLFFAARFRSPWARVDITIDSFTSGTNALFANAISPTYPKNHVPYVDVYDPFSILGPMYGVIMEPAASLPYNKNLLMTVSLPAAAPIAQTTCFGTTVSRARIQDKAMFLRSLKKFNAEQMTGAKLDRFP